MRHFRTSFRAPNLAIVAASSLIVACLVCGCNKSESSTLQEPQKDKTSVKVVNSASGQTLVVTMPKEAQDLSKIEIAQASKKMLDLSVKTTGEVLADANLMTHVTAPVAGRVTEVLVRIGDHIQEGKPLLTIRSTDLEQSEADLLQNEAQVKADLKRDLLQVDSDIESTQAQLKLDESTFNRLQNLLQEKIASQADFEAAKTAFEKNKIMLASLKRKRDAVISLADERVRLLTEPIKQKLRLVGVSEAELARVLRTREIDPIVPVVAPESGIISDRMVNVGELVDTTKPLFTIGDYHDVWLKADVYEKDVSKVHEGQQIELELDSFPGERFKGRLDYVADSLSPETRTLAVRAEVPNPGLKLKPKMFARMNILVGEQSVLTIPKKAVQDAGTDKVVYVPLGSGQFEERKVNLGCECGEFVEVLSGLRNGDKIVTTGSFDLRSESLRQSG